MDAHTVNSIRPHPRTMPMTQPARRPRRRFLRHIFRRKEITTFQRCLAVHMYFAARVGAL
jgi:hypothetical protein